MGWKKSFVLGLVVTAAFSNFVHGKISKDPLRCGGEGPHPLIDITGAFDGKAKIVPNIYDVKEFLLWDKLNLLLFRDSENAINLTNTDGVGGMIAGSVYPIAPVVDPQERYVATLSSTWVFDRFSTSWYHYDAPVNPVDPVFFNKNTLYSLNSKIDEAGKQTVRIFRYTIGNSKADTICTLTAKSGEALQLARGHSFPNVFLYRTEGSPTNPLFSLYAVDVTKKCHLFGMSQYTRPISGPVRSVHFLADPGALAVEVDHPHLNLLWDSLHGGCRYYDIGTKRPIVPNYKKPIVATFSPEEGMRFIYLDRDDTNGYEAHINQFLEQVSTLQITEVTQKDIWLSGDATNFYLTPKFKERGKMMIQLKLTDNRPPQEN